MAQLKIPKNQYGLQVVEKIKQYHQLVKSDSDQQLVNLQKYIPGIRLDIQYATKNNFTHQQLYRQPKAYLRLPAAKALEAVQEDLKKRGLGIMIFDAYRPYSVTEKMWQIVPDDRYAADPHHGSNHNRGIAVDLTLINMSNGDTLSMPTGFDNFTNKAHQDYNQLDSSVVAHRALLKNVMEVHGFKPLSTEWWHFTYQDDKAYPLMNISFRKLGN